VNRFKKHARLIAFVVLIMVTAFGIHRLLAGDYTSALDYWRGKGPSLLAALACSAAAAVFNYLCWMWLSRTFSVRVNDPKGVAVFLSAHAGQLLPVHLGVLLRPDTIVRLGRGVMGDCLRVEAVAFYLDVAAAGVTMAGLLVAMVHPLAGILLAVLVSAVSLLLADRLSSLLSGTRIALPTTFWWSGRVFGMLLLTITGWLLNGLALHVLICDLPGGIRWTESLFISPFSASIGAGTGLPGGIGAIEGMLGLSLRTLQIPGSHLALAVGAYRLVTFWVWLPIGWIALWLANRNIVREVTPPSV